MTNPKQMHRPTLSSSAVFELINILETIKNTDGLSKDLREYLNKLDRLTYEINKGIAKPAYVVSGIKKANSISIESLGGNNSPIVSITYTPEQKEEAELAATMYHIEHGIIKDWKEFLNVEVSNNDSIDNTQNSNQDDSELFKSITMNITVKDL